MPAFLQTRPQKLVATYSDAQLGALRAGLAFLALFALLALAWVRRLPTSTAQPDDPVASPTPAP